MPLQAPHLCWWLQLQAISKNEKREKEKKEGKKEKGKKKGKSREKEITKLYEDDQINSVLDQIVHIRPFFNPLSRDMYAWSQYSPLDHDKSRQ